MPILTLGGPEPCVCSGPSWCWAWKWNQMPRKCATKNRRPLWRSLTGRDLTCTEDQVTDKKMLWLMGVMGQKTNLIIYSYLYSFLVTRMSHLLTRVILPCLCLFTQAIHRFRVNRGRHILLEDNYVFLPSVSESASWMVPVCSESCIFCPRHGRQCEGDASDSQNEQTLFASLSLFLFGKHNEELENLFNCKAHRCILLHRFVRWRRGNNESVLCTAEDRRDSHRPEEEELAGSSAPAGGPRNPLKWWWSVDHDNNPAGDDDDHDHPWNSCLGKDHILANYQNWCRHLHPPSQYQQGLHSSNEVRRHSVSFQ